MGVGGGEDELESNGYGRIIRWDDAVSKVILGTDHNSPLFSAPGLELHCPIMSMLVGHRVQLER